MASKKNYNKISAETAPVEEPKIDVIDEVMEAELQGKPIPEEPVTIGVVSNCSRLNIRKKSNVNAEIIGRANMNDEVTVDLDKSTKTFYKIETKFGLEGYCMKEYITIK